MPEAKTRTIAGHEFTVSQPYEEGMTINAEEARALNQTRAENVGNNCRSRVKELVEAGNVSEAEKIVAEYDDEYVFTAPRTGGGGKSVDPVEREARKLARQAITAKLRAAGRKVKDIDKEKMDAAIEEVAQREDIVAEAKKAVKAQEKLASNELGDLGLS